MSIVDKAKNAADKAVGQAEEALGDAKGDDRLKAEGQSEQTKASAKQVGEDVKDIFK